MRGEQAKPIAIVSMGIFYPASHSRKQGYRWEERRGSKKEGELLRPHGALSLV
jgi:hypothetical protein